MALELPKLDDLTFQQIVDHAKKRIAFYCPEWTDHNVSDPGITLIELFAEMVEMLLYRVNRLPESVHMTLLNLLGVAPEPPKPARVPVSFYLSREVDDGAFSSDAVVISAGTEVATIRTEVMAPVVFTTINELVITPPRIIEITALHTRRTPGIQPDRYRLENGRFVELVGDRQAPVEYIHMFRNSDPGPQAGDALYLALDKDHSNHVLRLKLGCAPLEGTAIDTSGPAPYVWEVATGAEGRVRWQKCAIETDDTGYLSKDGAITLRVPDGMRPHTFPDPGLATTPADGVSASSYWLRCRVLHTHPALANQPPDPSLNAYTRSPRLRSLSLSAVGGTVEAEHATVVKEEHLGQSNGLPGQSFRLRHRPVLQDDRPKSNLIVRDPDGVEEVWQWVEDFTATAPEDKCFTLDHLNGTIALPPVLPQPGGGVYRFGAVPAAGSRLFFEEYRYWDGEVDNVSERTLTQLPVADGRISRVINWTKSRGGRPAESLEDAMRRAARLLRTREVAVTANDFEVLAMEPDGPGRPRLVGRAHCIAPGNVDDELPRPGLVRVVIFPHLDQPDGRLEREQIVPSEELREKVENYLSGRAVLGCRVKVEAPRYVAVNVRLNLVAQPGADLALRRRIEEQTARRLYAYLNPYTGGPAGKGWPFGRRLTSDELRSLVSQIPGVDQVDMITLDVERPGAGSGEQEIRLGPDQVICSGSHTVTVRAYSEGGVNG